MLHGTDVHLLLSGGGFRATLFHLGVLRFLYEYKQGNSSGEKCGLHDVRLISGISGGSITAAHFVANCDRYRKMFLDPAKELIDFTKTIDLRREVLQKGQSVANVLSSHLFKKRFSIDSTPEELELVLLGTSLKTGNCIAFEKSSIESLAFEPRSKMLKVVESVKISSICVSNLIQASAAFPPFFPPLHIDRSIFITKPNEQDLGTLAGDEVADGGIRDNLGLDWYVAKKTNDSSSLLVVSDAGQAFDWDRSSKSSQSFSTWINRLLRAVNIQMMRLSQLDKSTHFDSPETIFVGFDSRKELPVHEDPEKPLLKRTMTAGVGVKAVEIATDLAPIQPAQAYAIVRLGYDIAKLKLSNRYDKLASVDGRMNANDGFWELLKPKNVSCLADQGSKDRETSLEVLLEKETNANSFRWTNIVGYYDIWLQIPLRKSIRRLLVFLALLVFVFTAVGAWTLVSSAVRAVSPYLQAKSELKYSNFLELVQLSSWEDACNQIKNKKLQVQGKLFSKRGDVITVQLDQLQELAKVRLLDSSTASALPNDPDERRPYFLILKGLYRGDEPHPALLNLVDGELLSTLETRPASWGD